jgi:tRNA pseudouridine synthase 10
MTGILKTVERLIEDQVPLCPRCLGRLFGKLGHNLNNPVRGVSLNIMLQLKKSLKDVGENRINPQTQINKDELDRIFNSYSFHQEYQEVITNITNNRLLEFFYDNHEDSKREKEQNSSESNGEQIDPKVMHHELQQALILLLTNARIQIEDMISNLKKKMEDTEYCIICQGLFDDLDHYANIVCESIKEYEFKDFLIGCKIDKDIKSKEEEIWSEYGLKYPELIKTEFNRELGKLIGERLKIMVNFDLPEMTIIVDTRYDTIKLQVASLFIYGRYRKLVRDIPQTRWPCKQCWGKGCKKCNGTGKIYETSVEEEIAALIMKATGGKSHFFHGMGREDIGVRMLGSGRPFILEISEPKKRDIDLNKLRTEINEYTKDKVEISGLKITTHRAVRQLKAAKPDKTYQLKVKFDKKVNSEQLRKVIHQFGGVTIKQRTPIRVSHRRADLVRDRNVRSMELLNLEDNGLEAEIKILGESGLYIKELIHGDSGRTIPSLANQLDTECTVLELDVLNIHDNEELVI